MLLSIIIPVYNVKKYLSRCLESILNQDFNDYQIVIIDDGSTDGSSDVCDYYAKEHPCVFVTHQPNGGLSNARNHGINLSLGEFIMFLDSDDWLFENCLGKISTLLQQYRDVDLLACRAVSIDVDNHKKDKVNYSISPGLYHADDYLTALEKPGVYSACAPFSIYRRRFLLDSKITFKEGIIHEDELWTPMVLLKAKRIYVSDIYFYYHFQRVNSINMSKDFKKHGENLLIVVNELLKLLKRYPYSYARAIREQTVVLYLQAICFVEKGDYGLIDKRVLRKNCLRLRTKMKFSLFRLSPSLYVKLHNRKRGL